MPIRDGVDRRPLARCRGRCGKCETICARSIEDAELRAAGWHPIDEAPLEAGVELEGLTTNGSRVLAVYYSGSDYSDRWVSATRTGPLLDLTHWRPLRMRLPGPLRRR